MMIQSNINYRLDIVRKHTKIGEAKAKNFQVQFVEDADVTRSMKAVIAKDGFKTNSIEVLNNEGAVYFNGSLFFDGTWSFGGKESWETISVDFDMFSDRLRPVMIIDGVEKNLGDFLVIAAPLTDDGFEELYNIEAYDETMLLKQSTLPRRKYYASGTRYIDIVMELLTESGIDKIIKDDTNATITIDHEYPIGTNYLRIINELLDEIGYSHVYAGTDGSIFIRKNITKNSADYYYTDINSTLLSAVKTETDIYSLPNVIVGYVSSPDIPTVLRAVRTNDNPNSVISTVRRGYNIVKTYQFDDCPDLETLARNIDQKFMEASQATETAEIQTMPDDNHEYASYIALGHSDENGLYREVEWSITANGNMTHRLERKVFV